MDKSKAPFAALSSILALAALIVFLFLPVLSFGTDDPTTYTGIQVLLGHKDKIGNTEFDVLAFSMLVLIALIGIGVGFILNALSASNRNKLFILIGTIGLFAGTVLVFMTPLIYTKGSEFQTLENILNIFGGTVKANLGNGAIFSGSLAGLATLISGYELIRK